MHLELDDVSKRFGGVRALDRVSLAIERGSVHALVGENGAGKSTLGRIVAGALAPDSGRLLVGDAPAASLRTAEQQKVEILRALARDATTIVIDEPAAALSAPETEQLHEIVRRLAASGKTIVLISHFLREVLELAGTVSILREGVLVRTGPTAAEDEESLVVGMLGGRSRPRSRRSRRAPRPRPWCSRCGACARRASRTSPSTCGRARSSASPASSVPGAPRSCARSRRRPAGGRGRDARARSRTRAQPRASLRAGVALIPESRKDQGLVFGRSLVDNVPLPRLGDVSRFGVVRRRAERRAAEPVLARCAVRGAPRPRRRARSRAATSRSCSSRA